MFRDVILGFVICNQTADLRGHRMAADMKELMFAPMYTKLF